MSKDYTHTTNNLKNGDVKIEVKVSPEKYLEVTEITFEDLAKDVEISGFRPGKGPRAMIENKLGSSLMSETARRLLPEISSEIIETEDLSPVTPLEYDITKISNGDGVEFTISFTNYPEIKIGDIEKLTVEVPSVEVSKEEVNDVIDRLFQENEDKTHKNITEEDITSLGIDGMKTKDELITKISEQLQGIKRSQQENLNTNLILDAAIKKTEIEIPEGLLKYQTDNLVESYLGRIRELDVNVEEFLKAQGIDEEQLIAQKSEEAKHKLLAELTLNEIVRKYDLVPTSEDIENELDSITDPEVKDSYDSYEGRRHILSVLIQQRGIQKLKEVVKLKEEKEEKKKSPKKPGKKTGKPSKKNA